jgi:hypothetical protein
MYHFFKIVGDPNSKFLPIFTSRLNEIMFNVNSVRYASIPIFIIDQVTFL